MPTRLRRKLVRLSGGRASHRRIISARASSLSFFSAAARLSFFLFTQSFLEQFYYRQILRAAGCTLALNDVGQIGHTKLVFAKFHYAGAAAESFEGPNAVKRMHEVDL